MQDELKKQKRLLKTLSASVDKQTELIKLIIEKFDIKTESEIKDENEGNNKNKSVFVSNKSSKKSNFGVCGTDQCGSKNWKAIGAAAALKGKNSNSKGQWGGASEGQQIPAANNLETIVDFHKTLATSEGPHGSSQYEENTLIGEENDEHILPEHK